MAQQNLTPRQKMINMLYLVLTAILALNVSNEVLDAFKSVNDSINTSNLSVRQKTANTFSDFTQQAAIDSGKAKQAYMLAGRARQLSQELYGLLEDYKTKMVTEAGGMDKETGKIVRDDDINIATRLFVEDEGKTGKDLKLKIEQTRKELLSLIADPVERREAEKVFALKLEEPGDGRTWEFATFNHIPVVAAVTTLSKYQNDILNAESHIVENLYNSVYKKVEKMDRMEAMISSPSSLVLQGEAYKADVMIAASSSSLVPEVFLGAFTSEVKKNANGRYETLVSTSDKLPLSNAVKMDVNGGIGRLSLPAGAVGDRKYTGVVRSLGTDGLYKFFPFEGQYQVAPKTAVVSPKMMNVLYIGLDNLVDVSVPGYSQRDVTASISDGELIKNGDGSYNARVKRPGTTRVLVKTKVNNREMIMGEQEFRVKRIPNPSATLDGLNIPVSCGAPLLKPRTGIVAKVVGFDYPAAFRVLSFTVTYRQKDGQVFKKENTGPAFNNDVKQWMKNVRKDEAMFFDDIIVQGPDGEKRKIDGLAFNVTIN